MIEPNPEDTHNYFDCTLSTYHQNVLRDRIESQNSSNIISQSEGSNRLQFFNCLKTYPGQSQILKPLDYCSISMRPMVTHKKFKQLKITNFLEDDSAYQGDSENSPDSGLEMEDIIESTNPKSNSSNKKPRKVHRTSFNGNKDVDTLAQLM